MVWCSTLVLFVLLTWLQEAIRQGKLSTGHWGRDGQGRAGTGRITGSSPWSGFDGSMLIDLMINSRLHTLIGLMFQVYLNVLSNQHQSTMDLGESEPGIPGVYRYRYLQIHDR